MIETHSGIHKQFTKIVSRYKWVIVPRGHLTLVKVKWRGHHTIVVILPNESGSVTADARMIMLSPGPPFTNMV